MGITRKHKDQAGIYLTRSKLEELILRFLIIHATDMAADYKPESFEWQKQLSENLARYIHITQKSREFLAHVGNQKDEKNPREVKG